MASSQISPRFVIFVVVSLLTHLMDVAASGLFCHMLMQQDNLKTPWFSISAGLLIIPLVGLQLISAVYLLRRKGETTTTMEVILTAILHVLQLGFISRHFAILQESSIASKKYEIAEILVLRMVFSFTSGLPLLLIKLHMLFRDTHEDSWEWVLYLTSATALLAVTWALATFRRRLSELTIDSSLITCPGTLLKFLWRAGEIATRVIALSLFASLYSYWLFLVIGLHWFAMLVCVCVPAITPLDVRSNSFVYRSFYSIVASFTYVFVFINTTSENTVFRYTFYYIIFFLENTVLITVWSVQASSEEQGKHEAFVYVAAVAFIVSIISMIVYYKFFHNSPPKENETTVCDSATCASCKLNIANSHPPIPPRPGSSGHWLSQYHTTLYCGQYCKHHGQDSLLDSTSEKNSTLTVSSSHARLQQKLATINGDNREPVQSSKTSNTISASIVDSSTSEPQSVSSRSKSRKKGKKKNERKSRSDSDKTSTKTGGSVSENSGSQKQPVWLPSGDSNFAKQLLTYSLETFDTNDAADDERSSVATGVQDAHFRREISSRELSSVHKHMDSASWSAPKRGEDRRWYSDGYSTDRTLDWSNFPVNSLQRNMYNANLDTDEDHPFNCHECSHGDSEVSSIMRSLDDVPETFPSGRRSREISPRDRSDEDRRKHHHRHHHHHHHHHHLQYPDPSHEDRHRPIHRHQENLNFDTKPKASHISNDVSVKDTDKSNKPCSKSQRTHMLSSPASDPSHGPKPKRKGSPKRRIHGSAHPDRSASKCYVTDQQDVQRKIHHEAFLSRSPATDNRMIQSEQIATELLAKSLKSNKSKKQKSSPSAPTPDPRFNVRVMVTDATERRVDNYDGENIQAQPASTKNMCVEKRADSYGKKTIFGVTEKETDVDRYIASTNFEEEENQTDLSHLAEKFSSSEKRQSCQSAQSSDVQTTSTENSPISEAEDGKGEAIYENIWQVKGDDKTIKSKLGVKNLAFVEDEPRKLVSPSSTGVRDAWYMCSESEDSALPPEALSSSVDGFTGSENGSDVSVEIVI